MPRLIDECNEKDKKLLDKKLNCEENGLLRKMTVKRRKGNLLDLVGMSDWQKDKNGSCLLILVFWMFGRRKFLI